MVYQCGLKNLVQREEPKRGRKRTGIQHVDDIATLIGGIEVTPSFFNPVSMLVSASILLGVILDTSCGSVDGVAIFLTVIVAASPFGVWLVCRWWIDNTFGWRSLSRADASRQFRLACKTIIKACCQPPGAPWLYDHHVGQSSRLRSRSTMMGGGTHAH